MGFTQLPENSGGHSGQYARARYALAWSANDAEAASLDASAVRR